MLLMARRDLPAESELLLPVLRGLIRLSWAGQMTPAAVEVPWHQKRVDLVVSTNGSGLIAVELKVAKWRKAVDQAYVNRWAATSSWVGLWHECITEEAWRYAGDAGVGLLAVTATTVYPLARPQAPPRPEGAARLTDEVTNAGLRLRDLLSAARGDRFALA
jgi:hypothetical protein